MSVTHQYFLSYIVNTGDGRTIHGTVQHSFPSPITCISTIREWEENMQKERNFPFVLVTSYQLLCVEEEIKDMSKFKMNKDE